MGHADRRHGLFQPFVLAVLVPTGIAHGLEAALEKAATYVVPTVVSAYCAAGTFALRRIAR